MKGTLIPLLVAVFLIGGCGEKKASDCEILKEYIQKAETVIKHSTGGDRKKRLSDLKIEYAAKLKKVDSDTQDAATLYIETINMMDVDPMIMTVKDRDGKGVFDIQREAMAKITKFCGK